MIELTGKIIDMSRDFISGKPKLTLEINEEQEAMSCYNKLHNTPKISMKISKFREKRSSNANAYFWSLCGKLAETLSDEKVKHTKEEIYRNAIKEIGVYREQEFDIESAKTFRHAWEMLGTGWITEQVDFSENGENVIVRFYYGSSTYNTKQMSRLINNIVQDCEAVGIETKTPDELANMLSLWKAGE